MKTPRCPTCKEQMILGALTQTWYCIYCEGGATKREIDTSDYPAVDTETPDMFDAVEG